MSINCGPAHCCWLTLCKLQVFMLRVQKIVFLASIFGIYRHAHALCNITFYHWLKHCCKRKVDRTKITCGVNWLRHKANIMYNTSYNSTTRVIFEVVWLLQGCLNLLYMYHPWALCQKVSYYIHTHRAKNILSDDLDNAGNLKSHTLEYAVCIGIYMDGREHQRQ